MSQLHQLIATAQASSAVLVFIQRPGAPEPEVVEVVKAVDVSTEDAFILYVEVDD